MHHAGLGKLFDHKGIVGRDEVLEHARTASCPEARRHQHVLVRDRDAGQRARATGRARLVGGLRLRQRTFAVERQKGVERGA